MSPYEFTSKTHSLSTEDLDRFFIHSFIDLPFTPWELFTLNGQTARKAAKISRKSEKNMNNVYCC